jgi:drug/metabolite transporter (DMT)-like permease
MSPLWSTLLGMLVLRERLNINRVIALLLAFGGLYIVLVVENGLPVPRNTGDWFALVSGLCWSVASVKLFQDGARMMLEKVITFVVCALAMALLLMFLQQGGLQGAPGLATLKNGSPWILLVAVLMFPIVWLTIWPTTLLSPARVGMLLLVEVLVGVASAAILLDEPFGLREMTGAILILSAGVVEVMRQQTLGDSVIVDEQNLTAGD